MPSKEANARRRERRAAPDRNFRHYQRYLDAVDDSIVLVERAQHRLDLAILHNGPGGLKEHRPDLIAKKWQNLGIAFRQLRDDVEKMRFYSARISEMRAGAARREASLRRLLQENPQLSQDRHVRHRAGNDDHLELGVQKRLLTHDSPAQPGWNDRY